MMIQHINDCAVLTAIVLARVYVSPLHRQPVVVHSHIHYTPRYVYSIIVVDKTAGAGGAFVWNVKNVAIPSTEQNPIYTN